MSLINQALRKAQRDRTPERMPEPGASAPASIASASGMKPRLIIALIALVAVLLGLVAGLSIVLWKDSTPAPTTRQTSATSEQTAVSGTTTETSSAKASVASGPSVPQAGSQAQRTTFGRESATPAVGEPQGAREAAEDKDAAKAESAEPTPEPSQAVIDWLARAQITGVKISAGENKVVLNGESYAAGEYVNDSLRLKVTIIQEKRVLFTDSNGQKYLKQL